jgi:hypothetical protein
MMLMSTLDVSNEDFLGGGSNRFHGASTTGVSNFGTISSSGGDVVLLGGFVNNEGQIGALNGTVAIGSGGDIILQEGAGSKISVRGSSDYTGTGINNSGTIQGAAAEMKAHGNVYALAINNGGAIRATGADRSNGRVRLMASGGSSNINLGGTSSIYAAAGQDGGSIEVASEQGDVTIGGTVDASGSRDGGSISVVGNTVTQAANAVVDASGGEAAGSVAIDAVETVAISGAVRAESADGTGGNVTVTGRSVLINDNAELSVNGSTAGGTVLIGGDFQGDDRAGLREADTTTVAAGARITADSTGIGNAGTAIVWANDDTIFHGEISASARGISGNGGLVEVSGRRYLFHDGVASASAVNGSSGTVLFDPGSIVVGDASGTPPPGTSFVTIASINNTLQGGTNVLLVTSSGSIIFNSLGGGGFDDTAASGSANNRHTAIQWTNSNASFGAFASGSVIVNNHIRTSGAGSISLLGGWTGQENDAIISATMGRVVTGGNPDVTNLIGGGPQAAWDAYVAQGAFGELGGGVSVGSTSMTRHVEVGSRFGDTNVAGFKVLVQGSDDQGSVMRYAQIGFHESGLFFAPRLDKGGEFRLDMKVGSAAGSGAWFLSDGRNTANQAANGVGDPIVAIAGNDYGQEVDRNGDGIVDGVHGINSTGVLTDTFIPYANHFNSVSSGNWWWQQIDAAAPDVSGLGGLRPEHGAGIGAHSTAAIALGGPQAGANINVIAKGNVELRAGGGQEHGTAMIGHGGPNRSNWGGAGMSTREVGNEDPSNGAFSHAGIEGNQMERRWSLNGSGAVPVPNVLGDYTSSAIARLAPVYGNINVLAGVDTTSVPIVIDRALGTVSAAAFKTTGDVLLQANQNFKTSTASSNSQSHIGHGGVGQFGEFYGDIRVEAGGKVSLLAGEATRSAATIGHNVFGHATWNTSSNVNQQLRFFATAGDFDNPNLRRGELFSGLVTTGFDPLLDPARNVRYNPANFVAGDGINGAPVGKWVNIHTNEVINMNPILYSRGYNGASAFSTAANSQGRDSVAPLTLAPVSTAAVPIVLEALDGSVVSGMHGNITVVAHTGDVIVKGYDTVGVLGSHGRDTRFAAIGHGGVHFGINAEGAGYRNISSGTINVPGITGVLPTGNVEGREIYDFRISSVIGGTVGGALNTGSRSEIGEVGTNLTRYPVFTTITGDIEVRAGRDINVLGGNDVNDHARIGHGGSTVADYETSSFILGDIRLQAGRDVNIIGGEVVNTVRAGDVDLRVFAAVGHTGHRTGLLGFLGDIEVNAVGNVLVRGGAYSFSFAKIGHQGWEDFGQAGGDFIRTEHFRHDGVETDILTTLNATEARIDYSSANANANSVIGVRDFTLAGIGSGTAGTLVSSTLNTANISVTAGGSVTVEHSPEGIRQPVGRPATANSNPDNQGWGLRTRNSYSQIGHGGLNNSAINNNTVATNNTATNFTNKIGDISVIANGGNIAVNNGTGFQRWARIGHGESKDIRIDDGFNIGFSRAIVLMGDINVEASGDIIINADAADENERAENSNAIAGTAPSIFNPAAIGHGGVDNNLDLVVLGRGENVKGIAASSDITAVAGGNMQIIAGKGVESSFAQFGHGFSSDQGNDAARRFGIATGFAGDISVRVAGDLLVLGGANAWSVTPAATTDVGRTVHGAFAAIGHGGYQLDAPSFGDITVYVGNDLDVTAQQRTDARNATNSADYQIKNPDSAVLASAFNFAKIGHFAVENGNRQTGFGDIVANASQTGNITVVVDGDLSLTGGKTPDVDEQTIYGAFAQIGHGGPAITGDLVGNITVLVKGDLSVEKGTEIGDPGTIITTRALNNYAMIGNGDVLYDTQPSSGGALFRRSASGLRSGNINVAAGNNATFTGALIGHADPAVFNEASAGNLTVAVSRLNPFFGGTGTLSALNGTVFSHGNNGFGETRFLMPARSNNLISTTTRINEFSSTYAGTQGNFVGLDSSLGRLAGRDDEVYLTPDLWWDETDEAAAAGISGGGQFPVDATSGQGGSIARVNTPGGRPNLVSLTPGTLGSSADIYRNNNGVSGLGRYTLYYDSIEAVGTNFPARPPGPPGPPIPTGRYKQFFGPFEGYDRHTPFILDELTGQNKSLYPALARRGEGDSPSRLENSIDGLFGEKRGRYSEAEKAEEEERRRNREEASVGTIGLTSYASEPGVNYYSSLALFGTYPSPEEGTPFSPLLLNRDAGPDGALSPAVPESSPLRPAYDPFSGTGNPE